MESEAKFEKLTVQQLSVAYGQEQGGSADSVVLESQPVPQAFVFPEKTVCVLWDPKTNKCIKTIEVPDGNSGGGNSGGGNSGGGNSGGGNSGGGNSGGGNSGGGNSGGGNNTPKRPSYASTVKSDCSNHPDNPEFAQTLKDLKGEDGSDNLVLVADKCGMYFLDQLGTDPVLGRPVTNLEIAITTGDEPTTSRLDDITANQAQIDTVATASNSEWAKTHPGYDPSAPATTVAEAPVTTAKTPQSTTTTSDSTAVATTHAETTTTVKTDPATASTQLETTTLAPTSTVVEVPEKSGNNDNGPAEALVVVGAVAITAAAVAAVVKRRKVRSSK